MVVNNGSQPSTSSQETSDKCGKCASKISSRQKTLNCNGPCNAIFHTTCLGVSAKDAKELDSAGLSNFQCDLCRSPSTMKNSSIIPQDIAVKHFNLTMEIYNMVLELKNENATLRQEIASVKTENTSLKESLNNLSKLVSDKKVTTTVVEFYPVPGQKCDDDDKTSQLGPMTSRCKSRYRSRDLIWPP